MDEMDDQKIPLEEWKDRLAAEKLAARLEEELPSKNLPKFTAREIRLIDNCKLYAMSDPAGLPGHNLIIIIAKLSDLLIGNELEEATDPRGGKVWHCVGNIWFYDDLQAPCVMKSQGKWYYSVPTHGEQGMALTEADAKAAVERVLKG